MNPILSSHTWVSLPNEVRYRIRSTFHIPRSSNSHVDNGIIITDGVTPDDLKQLTIEKMQKYLSTNSTDFHKLFDSVVAKISDELAGVFVTTPGLEVAPTEVPKKKGRPAKIQPNA